MGGDGGQIWPKLALRNLCTAPYVLFKSKVRVNRNKESYILIKYEIQTRFKKNLPAANIYEYRESIILILNKIEYT